MGDYSFHHFDNMNEEEQYKFVYEAMDQEKQADFYQKLRTKIQKYIERHPNSKYMNYLIAAPDFFHLMCKLLADSRVPIKNKLYIAGAILYFTSPIDLITDMIPGIGFTDDVTLAVVVIKSLLDSVDEEVIMEHWAGDGDVIEQLEKLLGMADHILQKGVFGKIKKLFGSKEG